MRTTVTKLRRVVSQRRGGTLATESLWGTGLELANLLSITLTFVLLGRSLGPERYGGYVAMYAVLTPVLTFAASGVVLSLLQHVVREHEPLASTVRACLSMSLGVGAVLIVACYAVAAAIVDDLTTLSRISIVLTELIVSPVVQICAGALQAARTYVPTAKVLMSMAIAKIAVVVVLAALGQLTIEHLAVTMLIATSAIAIVVLRVTSRELDFRPLPGHLRWPLVRTNLAYSIGISGASLNNDGDKAVLAANGFVRDNGLYGAATRVVGFGMIPITSLVNVTHRRFLVHEDGVRGQHLRKAMRFAVPAAVFATMWCLALIAGASLLPLALGDDFDESVRIVRWLAPVVILRALSIFPLNALMGLGHVALRSGVLIGNSLIALGIYLFLIPRYGWRGAVGGTLVSELIELMLLWSLLFVLQRREDRMMDAAEASSADPANITSC